MMHFVYILQNKNSRLYIGRTKDILKRIQEHNAGDTFSTKKYKPWQCIYLEGYFSEDDAKDREKKIKQFGRVYSQLKRRIQKSILDAQKVRG